MVYNISVVYPDGLGDRYEKNVTDSVGSFGTAVLHWMQNQRRIGWQSSISDSDNTERWHDCEYHLGDGGFGGGDHDSV